MRPYRKSWHHNPTVHVTGLGALVIALQVGAGSAVPQLESRLHRLGTTVGEGDVAQALRTDLEQLLGERSSGVQERGLHERGLQAPLHLVQRLPDLGRVEPEGQGSIGGDEVEVAPALGVLEVAAFALHEALVHVEGCEQPAKRGVHILREGMHGRRRLAV